jgi:hypothetical protein
MSLKAQNICEKILYCRKYNRFRQEHEIWHKIEKLKIKAKGGVNPGGPMIPAAQPPTKTNSGNKQPAAPSATNPKFAVQQKGGS